MQLHNNNNYSCLLFLLVFQQKLMVNVVLEKYTHYGNTKSLTLFGKISCS